MNLQIIFLLFKVQILCVQLFFRCLPLTVLPLKNKASKSFGSLNFMYENQIEIAGSLKIETSVGGHARKGLL